MHRSVATHAPCFSIDALGHRLPGMMADVIASQVAAYGGIEYRRGSCLVRDVSNGVLVAHRICRYHQSPSESDALWQGVVVLLHSIFDGSSMLLMRDYRTTPIYRLW